MKVIENKYTHYVHDNLEVSLNNSNKIYYNIHIVYFINCLCNDNWYSWLFNQINLVKHMKGSIYIISTIQQDKENEFREKVLEIFPEVIIECYYENEFEYRGIKKVWELAQNYNKSNDIFLYFHSKGITHHKSYDYNRYDNYNIILKDIEIIKEIFTIFPKIDKIGYSVGGIGWIWYNFWYARGSYIYKVERPIKTNRRHYYEDYISRKVNNDEDKYCLTERNYLYYENTLHTCYGFFTNKKHILNIGSYYCPGKTHIMI